MSIEPSATPCVSQVGSWLFHTSTCPRTFWWLASANVMNCSAGPQSYWPRTGSRASHFMTFSAVTEENWVDATFR